jgi:hypothetical protein
MNDKELLTYLNRIYTEGFSFGKTQQQKYEELSNYYKGIIWPRGRPAHRVDIVINYVKEILTRKVAMMTDVLPQIEIYPIKDERLAPVADILKHTIMALWQEHNWSENLEELLFYAQLFGTAFIETCWDQSLDWGEGDINLIVGDPRAYYIDPFIMKANKITQAEYVIHEYSKPTSLLRQQYPDKAHLIKPYLGGEEGKKTFMDKVLKVIKMQKEEPSKAAIERSLVRKYWIADRTLDNKGKPIYPTGRFIKCVGDVILDDVSNFYFDGRFPIDMFDWQFDPDSPYGIGEVEDLASPFKYYNKLIALILENIILSINTVWTGDIDSLTPSEREKLLTNKPGEFIGHKPGKPIKREPPPPLPAFQLEAVNYLKNVFDELSGLSDVVRGKRGGLTSGVAIESISILSQSLIRYQARRLEAFLNRVGQKLIARIFQFYSDDRLFYLLGSSSQLEKFKFIRSELMKPLQDVYSDEITRNNIASPEQLLYIAKKAFKDFRFRIVAGSTLAMTKVQRAQLVLVLFRLGIVDERTVLDILEFPNKEEILRRKEEEPPRPTPAKKVKIPEFRDQKGMPLRTLRD